MPFPRPSATDVVTLIGPASMVVVRALSDLELLAGISETERLAAQYRDAEIDSIERAWLRVQGEQAERHLEHDLNRLREMSDQEFLLSFRTFQLLLGEAIHRKLVNPDDYEDDSWNYEYESEDDRPFLYRIPSEYP